MSCNNGKLQQQKTKTKILELLECSVCNVMSCNNGKKKKKTNKNKNPRIVRIRFNSRHNLSRDRFGFKI